MRILWLSNAPWAPSGYGNQTALFTKRLAAAGHELGILCNYGLQGQQSSWEGIPCFPGDVNWGNRTLAPFAGVFGADLVVALCDAWVLQPDSWPASPPVLNWAPVAHRPAPAPVVDVLGHERIRPAVMSRFGIEQLEELEPFYIPCGIDTDVFQPRPELRESVRRELGIPEDVFLVGMVAANQSGGVSRKAFPQAFLGFAEFARAHTDAWIYVHSDPAPFAQGIPLDPLAEACGVPQRRLRFPDSLAWEIGYPSLTVSALYQAFDVLLLPSMGEGFGIPLMEAQACGVPVITSDHSAMRELCGAGWLVEGDPWWDPPMGAFLHCPSIAGIVEALEKAYGLRDIERGDAVEFASRYDADRVCEEHWLPLLETLGGRPDKRRLEVVAE